MRLLFKMQKQFGDDQATTDIISQVIKEKVQPSKSMMPNFIDEIEQEIFNRISNNLQNIAMNEFQPGLIGNAAKQKPTVFANSFTNVP